MREPPCLDPVPILRAPPSLIPIAAGLDELEKPGVGDVVPLDRKSRHRGLARGKFVVPAESQGAAGDTERCAAGGDSDPLRRWDASVRAQRVTRRPAPFFDRQLGPHVTQSLLI